MTGRSPDRRHRRRSFITRVTEGANIQRSHLAGYSGILQVDAYAGFNDLYAPLRKPEPLVEAGCWAHGRRNFSSHPRLTETPRAR